MFAETVFVLLFRLYHYYIYSSEVTFVCTYNLVTLHRVSRNSYCEWKFLDAKSSWLLLSLHLCPFKAQIYTSSWNDLKFYCNRNLTLHFAPANIPYNSFFQSGLVWRLECGYFPIKPEHVVESRTLLVSYFISSSLYGF